ncbi:GrxA family glutaredoxin [Vreelandella populi]|uniref:GrxA family glutaredoxin n=1 Tax=Vreelandella populi TaxID=2498858 RepID=A0A433L860_9GAMM|nr:GrxA family glutaredoxin [Halomonas populi]RUR38406.1 GrxA family glutaredoxin [Halomonas populi]RUR43556.1 GrxA family glutaredoxin [Halomonas populi]RUR51557.1 GrxA family glutaredoxin [Halomonas populi]
MFVVIFGRMTCPFCVRAIQLAKHLESADKIEGYRYVDMPSEGVTKEDIAKTAGKPIHTVPQVFVDQVHVGGFTEFDQFVRDKKLLSR